MPSVIDRIPNYTGKGVTYYAQVIDTDSNKPAYVKVWDTDEVPDWVLMYLLYDWACVKITGIYRMVLNIPTPHAMKPPRPFKDLHI